MNLWALAAIGTGAALGACGVVGLWRLDPHGAQPDEQEAFLHRLEFMRGLRSWNFVAEDPFVHQGEGLHELSGRVAVVTFGHGAVADEQLGASLIDLAHGFDHPFPQLWDALGELHGS